LNSNITRARRCGIGGGPADLGGGGGLDGGVQLGVGGQGHAGLDLAGVRIEHIAEAAGLPFEGLSVHEMADGPHDTLPRSCFARQ
jgi:hypothetical protein